MAQTITVVVPVHNEEGNIDALYYEVRDVFALLRPAYEYQLLFIDDGSQDSSVGRVRALAQHDSGVHNIELSRNFGKEAALTAGITHAQGDAIVLIDADLQHPPALIREFIEKWEEGADIVIGVRIQNPDANVFRRATSSIFSSFMSRISDIPTVPGATDFRLIDRSVASEFVRLTERGRLTRGLIDWLGFTRVYVPFKASKRHTGTAQYSVRKLLSLSISAFVSHSLLPLRLAGYLGFVITLLASVLGLFIIVEQVILGDPWGIEVSGTAMLANMILFLNGVLLISLGLVALYIEKIHRETLNRPLYVLRTRKRDIAQAAPPSHAKNHMHKR